MTLRKLDVNKYLEKEIEVSGKVKIDETHIILALPEGKIGDTYEISLDAIKTPEQVVSWVYHLSAKQWIDRDILRRFIKVASEHAGITL